MKMKPVLISRREEQHKRDVLQKTEQTAGVFLSAAANIAVQLLRWTAFIILILLAIVGLYSLVSFYPELADRFRQTVQEIQTLLNL